MAGLETIVIPDRPAVPEGGGLQSHGLFSRVDKGWLLVGTVPDGHATNIEVEMVPAPFGGTPSCAP